MDIILPCPHCGDPAMINWSDGSNGPFCSVKCVSCRSAGPTYGPSSTSLRYINNWEDKKAFCETLAIRSWNRRVTAEEIEDMMNMMTGER